MSDLSVGPSLRCDWPIRNGVELNGSVYSGCEAKDSYKSELNYCTSQEPLGEKTKKKISFLDVGEKLQRVVPGKTHAVG